MKKINLKAGTIIDATKEGIPAMFLKAFYKHSKFLSGEIEQQMSFDNACKLLELNKKQIKKLGKFVKNLPTYKDRLYFLNSIKPCNGVFL